MQNAGAPYPAAMTLKLGVLLLAVSFIVWRFRPRARMSWGVPLALFVGLLTVRTIGWLSGEPAA